MITQPQVEFRKHLGSGKLIIQIIDPGKWIFVLDGGLVDRPVFLDQTVCTITFLDEERRCSPSCGTWANEAFPKGFIDFLLKFKEFMWRHLVRTLGNRCTTGLQVDDKLDFSDRGYSRQFFWEDVEKFTNNGYVLDAFKGGGIQGIQRIDLRFR